MKKNTIVELRNNVVYVNGEDILEKKEELMRENNFLKKENQNYINILNAVIKTHDFVKLKIKDIEIQELIRKVNYNEKNNRKNKKKNK